MLYLFLHNRVGGGFNPAAHNSSLIAPNRRASIATQGGLEGGGNVGSGGGSGGGLPQHLQGRRLPMPGEPIPPPPPPYPDQQMEQQQQQSQWQQNPQSGKSF